MSTALDQWFSVARMSTYNRHPSAEQLYVWNTRITKAFLEDIQHVEVLLRNCLDRALSYRYGDRWYSNPALPLSSEARRSVRKAVRRAGKTGGVPFPGQVIAELSFDFWRFLLTRAYQSTVWPLVQHNLVADSSRITFETDVAAVYALRNRCAHHEPVVKQDAVAEAEYLNNVVEALHRVANSIDPAAAVWIASCSRIEQLRSERP